MKENSSFTTEKPIDYTQTKDTYEGNREYAIYRDSPLPPTKKPGNKRNVYDDDNIPDIDLPKTTDLIPDEVPRRDGPGGE